MLRVTHVVRVACMPAGDHRLFHGIGPTRAMKLVNQLSTARPVVTDVVDTDVPDFNDPEACAVYLAEYVLSTLETAATLPGLTSEQRASLRAACEPENVEDTWRRFVGRSLCWVHVRLYCVCVCVCVCALCVCVYCVCVCVLCCVCVP